ncbi:acyltransferase [Coprobacter sp. LH1063]|uniref:Acyltransferase n=2 Tax=Coprobacter tertius TaxID=2944915 RepID=A0ABT1MLA6_9BACT|nr:acyltransferase [Coprobacter tertius]MCP9612488.1 acyltransferase [Coprobacter tertius]
MKGLAIIAVLFIHTGGDGTVDIACRQLYNFPVALFFFLSGYFIKDERLDIKGIKHILIPYAIWTLLYFVKTTVEGSPVTTWRVINSLFFGGAFFPLYFLIVLIELKLISPWIVRHIRKMMSVSQYTFYKDWTLLITPATLCILYIIRYYTHSQPLIYAQIFPTWFIFYYIGAIMKFGGFRGNTLTALCCTLFGLYLSIWESAYINEVLGTPSWAGSQIKFSTFFYSLSFCILLMTLHQKVKRNIIVRLGELSFGIYLLHMPMIKITNYALNGILDILHIEKFKILLVNQLSIISISLLLCYIFLIVMNKFLPGNVNRYLGFR